MTPLQPPTGKIVVLNGFPGTGKLTILTHAQKHFPPTTRLLDNHLLIDPVTAIIPERCKEHYDLRRKLQAPIFQELRRLAQDGHIVLMTACFVDSETGSALFQDHLDIVRGTDIPIFWINGHCEQTAHEQRIGDPDRSLGNKSKLTDVGLVRGLRERHHLVEPSVDGQSARLAVEALDVSGTVEDSVSRLLSLIRHPATKAGEQCL